MPAERTIQVVHKDHLRSHIRTLDEAKPQNKLDFVKDSAAWTTSNKFEGHRGLPGVPLTSCPYFVNHEKALDSIETNVILSALVDQEVGILRRQNIAESVDRNVAVDNEVEAEAKAMLKKLNEAEKKFGLRTNRKEIQFMKKHYSKGEGMQLEGSPIAETPSYVYLERSMNMENDLDQELIRRSTAAWAAFGSLREATDQLTNPELRAHLFDSTVLPALCCAAEMWADTTTTSMKMKDQPQSA